MKERGHSVHIMTRAKARFRGSVILKLADRYTRGLPDIQILWADATSWIETKVRRKGKGLKEILRMDQMVMTHELGAVCGGRSWIVIYDEELKRTEVWIPRVLTAHVWPRVVGECTVNPYCLNALEIDLAKFNLQALLLEKGCLWVEGFNYDLPVRLVVDAIRLRRG